MVTTAQLPEWLVKLYPFGVHQFSTLHGANLSYVDEGPGGDEAVLMLHGNPTWSFFYRDVIQALAPKVRCIAPDHVGMGLSDKPQEYPYTLASRIADIEALVASLQLRKVHLVVHDWGGAIGLGWAVKHPELVGKIVVLNTAAFRSPHIPARIALCKAWGLGTLLVRGLNGFAGPATWMAMHQRQLSPEEKRAYLYPYRTWADRVAVNAFVKDIPKSESHPSHGTLAGIEAALSGLADKPMKIIWGGADFCFNDRFFNRWRELFPKAELNYLAQAGHYVLEDARPEAVGQVAQFLS
ncbi:MAG TPA: alpha/beta fold hydrolase [Opitutaceae bacterium]|nr:alpha/beta fold hydrolase [Opitutaceae bacterium]